MPRVYNEFVDVYGQPVPRTVKFRGNMYHWAPGAYLDVDPAVATYVRRISKYFRVEDPQQGKGETHSYQYMMSTPQTIKRNNIPFKFEPSQVYRLNEVELAFFRKKGVNLRKLRPSEDKEQVTYDSNIAQWQRLRRVALEQFNVRTTSSSTLQEIAKGMIHFDAEAAQRALEELGYAFEETDSRVEA